MADFLWIRGSSIEFKFEIDDPSLVTGLDSVRSDIKSIEAPGLNDPVVGSFIVEFVPLETPTVGDPVPAHWILTGSIEESISVGCGEFVFDVVYLEDGPDPLDFRTPRQTLTVVDGVTE